MNGVEHIRGRTVHARRGATQNRFGYGIDYVLVPAEDGGRAPSGPLFFSRNRANLFSLRDLDHGGAVGRGRGAAWAREVLAGQAIHADRLLLLAQPRVLGHVFNPVSFWLAMRGEDLIAVIAEVTNTYGDRHSYLCRHEDLRAIRPEDRLAAEKILHVSPFQPLEGRYVFRFDIGAGRIGIFIHYADRGDGGVYATLTGRRQRLTNLGILGALARRPLGARRVLALIHWQALKLWWKGARFRPRPEAPKDEVSG